MSVDPHTHPRTALVIGATGSLGAAVAKALQTHGWQVRALHRDPKMARVHSMRVEDIEWIAGDALNGDDVVAAARGVDVIFHGANPPRYLKWRALAMPMLANAIDAAVESGARLIFPGNVYNFGPDAGPLVDERANQKPISRKGVIRVEMERMLQDAAYAGGRSLIVRSGDFFGPYATSSWFGSAMIKPGKPIRVITPPGPVAVGHSWAYLPDLAETIARLADIEASLSPFAVFHFEGHWLEPGEEMVSAIRRATGKPELPIKAFPWPLLYLAAPFSTFARELIEMRYLWNAPLRLDNRKLLAVLGNEPHTPLDDAMAATLASFKCLPF
ncbi:MAG: NmrA family NAD(P)-binding protein [Halothiobacillus sp.]|jgi:nucleoside-diphosphate-sugar epimerase|nr:NmrA family NAD(P)-binding protein [Halothiobacillus sp.]